MNMVEIQYGQSMLDMFNLFCTSYTLCSEQM